MLPKVSPPLRVTLVSSKVCVWCHRTRGENMLRESFICWDFLFVCAHEELLIVIWRLTFKQVFGFFCFLRTICQIQRSPTYKKGKVSFYQLLDHFLYPPLMMYSWEKYLFLSIERWIVSQTFFLQGPLNKYPKNLTVDPKKNFHSKDFLTKKTSFL